MFQYFLFGTFLLYLCSSVTFVLSTTGKTQQEKKKWEKVSVQCVLVGVFSHFCFICSRIWIGGHFPTSNMFEFISFLCFSIVLSFLLIYFFYYRFPVLGAFVMPFAVILLSYASVFPKEVQPLIPALQSHWLFIHVTTAALGEGAFAIGFVAGLIYVIHEVGNDIKNRSALWLESIFILGCMVFGFSVVSLFFGVAGYSTQFQCEVQGEKAVQEYFLPPLIKPYGVEKVSYSSDTVTFEAPMWMKGEQAARKLNSVIWSIFSGSIIYGLLRLFLRKRLTHILYPLVKNLDKSLIDEISYRAIAIGYPIFTLGALIFAMIWANEAWGRFWGWDPKETWALITWLFYTVYLHFRFARGWQGMRSAWLCVGGFIIIMINLIIINLVIAGLHSYA